LCHCVACVSQARAGVGHGFLQFCACTATSAPTGDLGSELIGVYLCVRLCLRARACLRGFLAAALLSWAPADTQPLGDHLDRAH
jgi:hypothetical protein